MVNDRLKYNLVAVIAAFVLFGFICIYAISKSTSDMAAIVGSLTTAVGTIVGAYVGANVGAEGKQTAIKEQEKAIEKLEEERDLRLDKEKVAQTLYSVIDPNKVEKLPQELQSTIETFSKEI
jgi:hypothetical protein